MQLENHRETYRAHLPKPAAEHLRSSAMHQQPDLRAEYQATKMTESQSLLTQRADFQ